MTLPKLALVVVPLTVYFGVDLCSSIDMSLASLYTEFLLPPYPKKLEVSFVDIVLPFFQLFQRIQNLDAILRIC